MTFCLEWTAHHPCPFLVFCTKVSNVLPWKSSLLPETLLLCLPSPISPQSSGPMRTSTWRSRPAFHREQCTAEATVPMRLSRDIVATCQMYHFVVIHCLHLCVCILPISNVGAKVICCLTFCLETDVALSGSLELNLLHTTALKTTLFCIFFSLFILPSFRYYDSCI